MEPLFTTKEVINSSFREGGLYARAPGRGLGLFVDNSPRSTEVPEMGSGEKWHERASENLSSL